jgi:hypothetical protein
MESGVSLGLPSAQNSFMESSISLGSLDAGIVGSNSTQGMDVCIVCSYFVIVLFCM